MLTKRSCSGVLYTEHISTLYALCTVMRPTKEIDLMNRRRRKQITDLDPLSHLLALARAHPSITRRYSGPH